MTWDIRSGPESMLWVNPRSSAGKSARERRLQDPRKPHSKEV